MQNAAEEGNVNYAESETASTTDEVNRLRELEGCWEERYNKLRGLAVKLKAKIKEQEGVIVSLRSGKDEGALKKFQEQIDKLQDKLDETEYEKKQYLTKLNVVAESIAKDKESLASNDEIITKLRNEIDIFNKEKSTTETWKKQISSKVQTLRKELEANNVLKKEYEAKINKLNDELEEKDKQLQHEKEKHQETKNLLDQLSSECRKNSVLNLEMRDYEKSVQELSQKLEKQSETIQNLQSELDRQTSNARNLKTENDGLQSKVMFTENGAKIVSAELEAYRKKVVDLEDVIKEKVDVIGDITQLLEITKSENEDLSIELSGVVKEHQKVLNSLQNEKEDARNQSLRLQQSLREAQSLLELKENELFTIKSEFDTYKVRAQSVLKQNQLRDPGLEEKLTEDLEVTKVQYSNLSSALSDLKSKYELLETTNGLLCKEKAEYEKKCSVLEGEITDLKAHCSDLLNQHQRALEEHTETVRSLKVHTETLSQCYRQQILEQEVRHNKEIVELHSRLEKAPSPIENSHLPLILPREEAEGSESVESNPKQHNLHPVPLERLLNSNSDEEIVYLKKQLSERDSRLDHLTSLLSDTEKDLEKHVQMNKVLKEEIRRQQRSVEREKHAENLEYLKNVLFKFVTLSNSDEKVRLVPVLNTILKLSPEELQKLNMVAKGDPGLKSWWWNNSSNSNNNNKLK